ncbi:Oidioi.mRNA.OKI2018_I69.chr2.g4892.t1.cds [Oikopleura dioica]|uniref:Oidioi.mRNA.OKI2018_I69.chr2.g4892.t1.cds n=1 Tax=Oikopleura dioica TaxID=34765 RepID=A0ABN7T312_OIKDI|nr:Oidioi.mRNA.OKI2018_I69.chr2.g4892.t1.cds [Oikopleura dioica]
MTEKLPLQSFVNLILEPFRDGTTNCKFVDSWRENKVVPIPKPDGRARPITVVPFHLGHQEKAQCELFAAFVEHYGLVPREQFGFRRSRSCGGAAFAAKFAIDSLSGDLDDDGKSLTYPAWAMVSCDAKNAFGVIPHDKLLLALSGIVSEAFLAYIKEFLPRSFRAVMNGFVSDKKVLPPWGLPQGSSLSPVFYIYYCSILNNKMIIDPIDEEAQEMDAEIDSQVAEEGCKPTSHQLLGLALSSGEQKVKMGTRLCPHGISTHVGLSVSFADDYIAIVGGFTRAATFRAIKTSSNNVLCELQRSGIRTAPHKSSLVMFCTYIGAQRLMAMKLRIPPIFVDEIALYSPSSRTISLWPVFVLRSPIFTELLQGKNIIPSGMIDSPERSTASIRSFASTDQRELHLYAGAFPNFFSSEFDVAEWIAGKPLLADVIDEAPLELVDEWYNIWRSGKLLKLKNANNGRPLGDADATALIASMLANQKEGPVPTFDRRLAKIAGRLVTATYDADFGCQLIDFALQSNDFRFVDSLDALWRSNGISWKTTEAVLSRPLGWLCLDSINKANLIEQATSLVTPLSSQAIEALMRITCQPTVYEMIKARDLMASSLWEEGLSEMHQFLANPQNFTEESRIERLAAFTNFNEDTLKVVSDVFEANIGMSAVDFFDEAIVWATRNFCQCGKVINSHEATNGDDLAEAAFMAKMWAMEVFQISYDIEKKDKEFDHRVFHRIAARREFKNAHLSCFSYYITRGLGLVGCFGSIMKWSTEIIVKHMFITYFTKAQAILSEKPFGNFSKWAAIATLRFSTPFYGSPSSTGLISHTVEELAELGEGELLEWLTSNIQGLTVLVTNRSSNGPTVLNNCAFPTSPTFSSLVIYNNAKNLITRWIFIYKLQSPPSLMAWGKVDSRVQTCELFSYRHEHPRVLPGTFGGR